MNKKEKFSLDNKAFNQSSDSNHLPTKSQSMSLFINPTPQFLSPKNPSLSQGTEEFKEMLMNSNAQYDENHPRKRRYEEEKKCFALNEVSNIEGNPNNRCSLSNEANPNMVVENPGGFDNMQLINKLKIDQVCNCPSKIEVEQCLEYQMHGEIAHDQGEDIQLDEFLPNLSSLNSSLDGNYPNAFVEEKTGDNQPDAQDNFGKVF